jgi:[protein-PII] uridylyltransferase
VGRHVLETVEFLKKLDEKKDKILMSVFSDLPNPEYLFLAALFHDIGKVEKDHARKGVPIARRILERLGCPGKKTDEILFLIRNHLFLIETATRRDLNDEKVVVQCARLIGKTERLKCLYLLTWADSMATGPGAWNDWTANLVQELFFKTLHILEQGELATPDSAQKVKTAKKMIQKEVADIMGQEEIETLFEMMPPRYLLNTQPSDVVKHINMVKAVEKNGETLKSPSFAVDTRENESGSFREICFVAKDRPGLFSDIAGVMSLNNINILSSNIYTWRNGMAVDIFTVTKPLDDINPEQTWIKIKSDFESTLNGKLSLPYRLSRKAEPSLLSESGKPTKPPEVIVDNESSDFFTLIEVFAADHVGLLYQVTRTLFDLRLDIRVAKTGVKGDQIADIFYVNDLDGQKIDDEMQVKEIKRALLHQLKQRH